mgnify:CR=1 FL=1
MFYGFGYGSSTQYILYLLGILLAVIAQGWLSSTYSKYPRDERSGVCPSYPASQRTGSYPGGDES